MLEIVLAYNAEMRGLANYYRLAYCAKLSLRKLWFLLWQTSLLKTLAFKLRLSVNQVAHRLKAGNGLAVPLSRWAARRGSVAVFNLKHLDQLPELRRSGRPSALTSLGRRRDPMSWIAFRLGSVNTVASPMCRAKSTMSTSSWT